MIEHEMDQLMKLNENEIHHHLHQHQLQIIQLQNFNVYDRKIDQLQDETDVHHHEHQQQQPLQHVLIKIFAFT